MRRIFPGILTSSYCIAAMLFTVLWVEGPSLYDLPLLIGFSIIAGTYTIILAFRGPRRADETRGPSRLTILRLMLAIAILAPPYAFPVSLRRKKEARLAAMSREVAMAQERASAHSHEAERLEMVASLAGEWVDKYRLDLTMLAARERARGEDFRVIGCNIDAVEALHRRDRGPEDERLEQVRAAFKAEARGRLAGKEK